MTLIHVQTPRSAGEGSSRGSDRVMPIGCLSLAAQLQRHGYSVDFRDYQLEVSDQPHSPDALARFAADSASVIGLGCLVDLLPTTLLAARRIKENDPAKIIILGGPGPSDCPEVILERFPWVDIVVIGEAEHTIVELMACLKAGSDIGAVAGICYRKHEVAICSAPRARIDDLDSLGLPHPDGVDLARYDQASVISSRGCPYDCTFCDVAQLWSRKTTFRSMPSLVEELRALAAIGFDTACIQDDNFTLDARRVRDLSRLTREHDDLPAWSCLGRLSLVDEPLLETMAAGRCAGIFYGVESGSDEMLASIRKKTTVRQAVTAIEATRRYFEHVEAYFIWGYPDETLKDLAKTLMLASYLNSLGVLTPISLLSPLLRSPLFRSGEHELVLDPRFFRFNLISGLGRGSADARVLELIEQQPDIFAPFYTYRAPDAEQKLEVMGRFKALNDLEMLAGTTVN